MLERIFGNPHYKLLSFVVAVLAWMYVQSDEVEIASAQFAVAPVLADLAELAVLDADEDRALDVVIDVPDDASVCADPRQFQRALENVLRNAARYAAQTIRVTFTTREGAAEITVHDDGPGIPVDVREQVTTPFFRVDADRGFRGPQLGQTVVTAAPPDGDSPMATLPP